MHQKAVVTLGVGEDVEEEGVEEGDMAEEDMVGVVDAKLLTNKNVTPQTNRNVPLLLINNAQQLTNSNAQLHMNKCAQPLTRLLLNSSVAPLMRSNARLLIAKCALVEALVGVTEAAMEVLVDMEVDMAGVIGMVGIEVKEVQVDMVKVCFQYS